MNVLNDMGLKNTPSRLAILELLGKEQKPVDASELIKELRWQNKSIDQATVYRILELFYEKGLIDRFEFGEGKYRYEIKREDHHHLVCKNCGRIEDIKDNIMHKWENEIRKTKGFKVKTHNLEFFGLCPACQR